MARSHANVSIRTKLAQGLRALKRLNDPWAYSTVITAMEFACADSAVNRSARKGRPWPIPCNRLTASDLEAAAQRMFSVHADELP